MWRRPIQRLTRLPLLVLTTVRSEVMVREEVTHASDVVPRDAWLGRDQLRIEPFDRLPNLQQTHGDGIHDDLQ